VERPPGCLQCNLQCDHVQTESSFRSPGQVTASSLLIPSFPPSIPTADYPAVSSGMRTSERDSFTRKEHMSIHSDDTPQRGDEARPGVKPELIATLSTIPILATPAPRTGEQDGEWISRRYDEP
jgi:hypothetical protein